MDAAPRAYLRKELAAATGVNAETLRFYEKAGVLQPSRSAKGYRVYGESDVKRLRLIQRAVGLGFRLDDVKAWLDGDRQRIAAALEDVERKLEELAKLRKNLKKRGRALDVSPVAKPAPGPLSPA
jgi:MerR family mercuric resistance operon transcriptional regulator